MADTIKMKHILPKSNILNPDLDLESELVGKIVSYGNALNSLGTVGVITSLLSNLPPDENRGIMFVYEVTLADNASLDYVKKLAEDGDFEPKCRCMLMVSDNVINGFSNFYAPRVFS